MGNRVTSSMIEAAARRIANRLGKPWGHYVKKDGGFRAVIGGWAVDHNAVYGGYIVEEIACERGSIRHPLLSQRLSASSMFDALIMVERALDAQEGR